MRPLADSIGILPVSRGIEWNFRSAISTLFFGVRLSSRGEFTSFREGGAEREEAKEAPLLPNRLHSPPKAWQLLEQGKPSSPTRGRQKIESLDFSILASTAFCVSK